MRRISKKVREEAALICAIAASGDRDAGSCRLRDDNMLWICDDLGIRIARVDADDFDPSLWLAYQAIEAARFWNHADRFAEAESLLRTGWSPS